MSDTPDATFTEEAPSKHIPLSEAVKHIDSWGKSNPQTNSLTAGAVAVGLGYGALVAVPAIAVPASILYSLYSIGNGTQKGLLKRWTK